MGEDEARCLDAFRDPSKQSRINAPCKGGLQPIQCRMSSYTDSVTVCGTGHQPVVQLHGMMRVRHFKKSPRTK